MSHTVPPELAQLRDIHLPGLVGWWPLAPGWYLLLMILVLTLLSLVFLLRRHYLQAQVKRQALHVLVSYEQAFIEHRNSQITAAQVSELLKRVALMYFSRSDVASLQGDAWIMFLNQTSKQLDFNEVRHELLEVPYQPMTTDDLQRLFQLARQWIHQRRGPCLN